MKHKKQGPANPLIPNESEYCVVDGKKKRKYDSRLDAELFAPAPDLHQYICEFCGQWHNGNSSRGTDED